MFEFLRNLTKSEEEKRQETLSAYLDNAVTPEERQAFEEQLRTDAALRASLEQQRLVKQNLSQLPRMRAPRNFTLDPAAYGRPAPQPAFALYPILRAATVVSAVLLIFLFSLELFSPVGDRAGTLAGEPAASSEIALEQMDETAAEEPAAAAPEIFNEESGEAAEGAQEAMEEAAGNEAPIEEVAEEEAVEEEAELAPAAEPQEGAAADTADEPTEQPLAETEETEAAEGDGTVTIQEPSPTTTLRFSTTATHEPDSDTNFFSETQTIPETEPTAEAGTVRPQPISEIDLLQIGLGILFLVLLAATLLIRRQL